MLLKKLLFSLFFAVLFFSLSYAQELKKIEDYKNNLLQQIKGNQKETNKITLLLKKLENNFAESTKQLSISEKKVFSLENKITKEQQKLEILNNKLQQTLNQVHRTFLSFYFLEKIQKNSIVPDFSYFKNYNRNQKIVEILLNGNIQVGKNIRKQVINRNQQLVVWNQSKKNIGKELEKLAITKTQLEFDQQQYSVFLTQLEKQQKQDEKTLVEIEQSLKNILQFKQNTTTNTKKNQSLPVYGELMEVFGTQNPKVPFYHKNGVLIKTNIQEEVRAINEGRVVFSDSISRYNILVIIDHGKGKMTTYGRLTNTSVKKGDQVKISQVIGEVAAYDEKTGVLYFAVRKNGVSVNPIANK